MPGMAGIVGGIKLVLRTSRIKKRAYMIKSIDGHTVLPEIWTKYHIGTAHVIVYNNIRIFIDLYDTAIPYFRQHGMTVYRLDHVGPRFYAGSSSNELYYSDDTCH